MKRDEFADYLSIVELSKALGVKIADIKSWMSQDHFPFVRKEGRPYFKLSEVFSWCTNDNKETASHSLNDILKLKEMESFNSLKIKNDILKGELTDRAKEQSRGYEVGKILKDSLTRIATLKAHLIRKAKTDKKAENLLIEYMEDVFIEIKELFNSQEKN